MGRRISSEEACLQMQQAFLRPLVDYPGVDKPWPCICLRCETQVRPRLASIRAGQGGCIACARKASGDARRYSPEQAAAAAEACGFLPLEPYARSSSPWRCKCTSCGRESSPTLGNLKRGHGCRFCSGAAPLERGLIEDLLSRNNLVPLEDYSSSLRPFACLHVPCGNVVGVRIAGLRHQGRGPCDFCGRAEATRRRRHSHDEVVSLLETWGLRPEAGFQYLRRDQKIPCFCLRCGNQVTPTFANASRGHGCRFCAPYGFNVNRPGVLYVLRSIDQEWGKFGITHNWSQRFRQHRSNGFFVEEVYVSPQGEGRFVAEVERHLLTTFRDAAKCASAVPGYSESFPSDHLVSVTEAIARAFG